ncbi:MAG: SGNH/GDSL hydrolase family protein [Sandaracinaceae bacterium]|nr:SGNH/GDSL hydrolase family protein [Sandaracinaceae bacterium]
MRNATIALLLLTTATPSLAMASEAHPTVRVIGDSHVERLGPMIDRAVAEEGYESLGHLARRGWSASRYIRENDMTERLTENGAPDIVVISLGGNDRCGNRVIYRKQLEWVVAEAREAGAQRIVWLGPAASDMERSETSQMVGTWHERSAEWQSEILPELGVEWIDSRPMTQDGHGIDGIHFTVRAYRVWCQGALAAAHLIDAAPADVVAVERTSAHV